jgi:hypothetical protein
MGLKPRFVTRKYLVARGPQVVNRAVDISPVVEKKIEAIKIHRTPVDNMLRTYVDLHPGAKVDEDSFIRGEFIKPADAKYGVKYVEEFHYIDESAPFAFLRSDK